MSHAFDARFPPIDAELPDVLDQLGVCLHASRISFDDLIMRLHSRGGVPTAMTLESTSVSSLEDVARVAKSWWGVSLYCISQPLAEVVGRTEAIEVYLRVFKTTAGWMMVYNEASGACDARAQSEGLTADLGALLTRLCASFGLDVACYAEEDGQARVPDLAEIEARLGAQAHSATALRWLAVAAERTLSLRRARELAGRWADRIRLSVDGYVLLPFLGGTAGE